jgi:hypothetical protein
MFHTESLAQVLDELVTSGLPYQMKGTKGKFNSKLIPSVAVGRRKKSKGGLDCSGFAKYVVHRGTLGGLQLIGGTESQSGLLRSGGFLEYDDSEIEMVQKRVDNIVRIGFYENVYKKVKGKYVKKDNKLVRIGIGHVWLVINGHTYESSSSGGGPSAKGPSQLYKNPDMLFRLGIAPNFDRLTFDGLALGHNTACQLLE